MTVPSNVRAAVPRPSRLWWPMLVLSVLVAGYAAAYVVVGDRMYPPQLADSFRARPWGIYTHAFFGMVALAVGSFQFRRSIVLKRPALHRAIGRVYLGSALLTGAAGLYMSPWSHGGATTHLGFAFLAVGLLSCTAFAWRAIKQRRINSHREWMIRSFAFLFSAVTLRLWLPILVAVTGSFDPAYRLVSWLCWIPNLIVAELIIRGTRDRDPLTLRRTALSDPRANARAR
ncbi:MAG: DUF2306 domain-containing protein [Gemmatimonadota bacterium]